MAEPTTVFENNHQAAHAVLEHLDHLHPDGHRFTLRPFQRWKPRPTHRWFVPSTDWPAYRYSKLFIRRPRDRLDFLYTGYRVERGMGQQVLSVEPKFDRKLIMQPTWAWFDFVQNAKAGLLDEPIGEVLQRSRCPVVLSMDLWEFNRAPTEEQDPGAPDDYLEFTVASPDLQFESAVEGRKILRELNHTGCLTELAERFNSWDELDWYWIDLFIGIRMKYGTEQTGTWRARQFWHNALEPWAEWVL